MKTYFAPILIALMLLPAAIVQAGHGCKDCGCQSKLKKVCRLVCEEEEVTETEWDCECEDFCVPGPSQICGEKCECDCTAKHGKRCHTIWNPTGCAEVRTRKVLVKKEVKKKVPSYKWVVEYVCADCCETGHH